MERDAPVQPILTEALLSAGLCCLCPRPTATGSCPQSKIIVIV